jgi:hypothetical protein
MVQVRSLSDIDEMAAAGAVVAEALRAVAVDGYRILTR